jgi:hypothetical protein
MLMLKIKEKKNGDISFTEMTVKGKPATKREKEICEFLMGVMNYEEDGAPVVSFE